MPFRFSVFAAVLAAASLCGQGLPTASPESLGLSSEKLERIGAFMERQIQEKRIAGAVTLVARNGRVAWFKAQGMMDREAAIPMRADAIFRICSMTKPITSAAVMMLYEEGRFALNDPVAQFLPEFRNPNVLVKPAAGKPYTIPARGEITIRQLLTHTAGLGYHWTDPVQGPMYRERGAAHGALQYNGTAADSVKAIASVPLLFHPGQKYEYSLSIDVLGRLVEVVSGSTLEEFFRKRIFGPLRMPDTQFFLSEDKVARLATAYTWYEGKGLNRFPNEPIVEGALVYSADFPYRGPKTLHSGGAGLLSTASDYARFCQMILNAGTLDGARVLSRKSVELMTHDQLGKVYPDFGFGLGFGVYGVKSPLDGLGSPGKFGWGGFYYTHFFIDPTEKMFGLYLSQVHPYAGLNLHQIFEALAYQAIID
jgi:CubicO group peptidase (beta-lactamase class C family)